MNDNNGDRIYQDNCGNLRDPDFKITEYQIEAFIESDEGMDYIMGILDDSDLFTTYIQSIAGGDDFPAGEIRKWVRQIVRDKLERDA